MRNLIPAYFLTPKRKGRKTIQQEKTEETDLSIFNISGRTKEGVNEEEVEEGVNVELLSLQSLLYLAGAINALFRDQVMSNLQQLLPILLPLLSLHLLGQAPVTAQSIWDTITLAINQLTATFCVRSNIGTLLIL